MTTTTQELAAGALGGLAGGAAVSALMLAMERRSGTPSELVQLERRAAARAGGPRRRADLPASAQEQAISHGGHLMLSAIAGAVYPAFRRASGRSSLPAGLLFGGAFYALAYGVSAPALGVTKPVWQDAPAATGQRLAVHALFGTITAFVADRILGRR